jgi:ATP phosphoribosyltransferase regulatory subunit HisZ
LAKAQSKAVSRFRKRLKRLGMARLEVNVHKGDAKLVRKVVRALTDPSQEQTARALLREHFGSMQTKGLKALLAAAPLEGIMLKRERDFGRDVDL